MKRAAALVLVGEANPDPSRAPFDGRSGRFLAGLCGLELGEFLGRVRAVNLLARDGPRAGKGRLFGPGQLAEASARARRLRLRGKVVVLAGKRVALAFGLRDPPWLRKVRLGRGELEARVVPHPSGIVRWWNDAGSRRRAARLLRRLLGLGGAGRGGGA